MTAIDFAAFVDQLASVSGETIRPFFRTALGVENKSLAGGFDPVTAADRAAEAAMRTLIKKTFPAHGIVGEELGAERADAEYVWVLDPIDGTKSFICGMPAWGTLIALTRRGRVKYGYAVNVEQALTDQVGVFGRWSWNDGLTEIMAFTDIDASVSFGTSIKGKGWGRPDDTIGIAGAINAISRDHRDFLAAGGLGVLVGDGALNYRTEKILETYMPMRSTSRSR